MGCYELKYIKIVNKWCLNLSKIQLEKPFYTQFLRISMNKLKKIENEKLHFFFFLKIETTCIIQVLIYACIYEIKIKLLSNFFFYDFTFSISQKFPTKIFLNFFFFIGANDKKNHFLCNY